MFFLYFLILAFLDATSHFFEMACVRRSVGDAHFQLERPAGGRIEYRVPGICTYLHLLDTFSHLHSMSVCKSVGPQLIWSLGGALIPKFPPTMLVLSRRGFNHYSLTTLPTHPIHYPVCTYAPRAYAYAYAYAPLQYTVIFSFAEK